MPSSVSENSGLGLRWLVVTALLPLGAAGCCATPGSVHGRLGIDRPVDGTVRLECAPDSRCDRAPETLVLTGDDDYVFEFVEPGEYQLAVDFNVRTDPSEDYIGCSYVTLGFSVSCGEQADTSQLEWGDRMCSD